MLVRHYPLMHYIMPDLHLLYEFLINVSPICLAIVCFERQNYPNPPHLTYEFEHENGVLHFSVLSVILPSLQV